MVMGFSDVDTIGINSNFDLGQGHHSQHDAGPTMADPFIYIQNMILSEATMRSFSPATSYFLTSGFIISLLSGSYFKTVLYRGIFEHTLNDRPINVLLLTGAIIHHVTHLVYGINLVLTIGFDVSFADVLGDTYCSMEWFAGAFGLVYLSVGSFGIAIFRTLCMKSHHWTNQPKWLLRVVLFWSLALSIIIPALFMIETNHSRVTYNACLGRSEFAQSILIDFRVSQGMDEKFGRFQVQNSLIFISSFKQL